MSVEKIKVGNISNVKFNFSIDNNNSQNNNINFIKPNIVNSKVETIDLGENIGSNNIVKIKTNIENVKINDTMNNIDNSNLNTIKAMKKERF